MLPMERVHRTINLTPYQHCCGGDFPHSVCRYGNAIALPYARKCAAPDHRFAACPYGDLPQLFRAARPHKEPTHAPRP